MAKIAIIGARGRIRYLDEIVVPKGFIKTKWKCLYAMQNGSLFYSNPHPLSNTKPRVYIDKDGYCRIWCENSEGKRKYVMLHRIIMETFTPKKFHSLTVNHKDGNKMNNDISNLEWMTAADNTTHAFRILKRSVAYGERGGLTKLKETEVFEIHALHKSGSSIHDLVNRFTVSEAQIRRILKGECWRRVKEQLE